VRVVKGYHAEEREEKIFAGGVQRLLDNVLKTLDGHFGDEPSPPPCCMGWSAPASCIGAHKILSGE
jgi:hypothetical protein